MMTRTQQRSILKGRDAALRPVNNVVSLRPPWRPIAPREDATTITNLKRLTHVLWERSHLAADIQRQPVGVHHDPMNLTVACHPLRCLR